jgi:hypothetical protein
MDDAAHARHATKAALACAAKLDAMNADPAKPFLGHTLKARIGLNSGKALVGNIGSTKRFNYTVMGDTVNLASRLEGANKYYGSTIMCADSVRAAIADDPFAWRELDRVQVKGRAAPVTILEPLGFAATLDADKKARADAFAQALSAYRARDFKTAAVLAAALADDPVAKSFAERLAQMDVSALPADWDGVTALDGK